MRLIDADKLNESKFPEVFNNFQEGWNDAIQAIIECEPTVNVLLTGWIPVTERLPDKMGFYIVRTNRGTITTARFSIDPVHLKEGIFPNNRHPTHWMPLPEFPEEVDNESN